jgi:nicotinamidase-related amidase
VIINDVEIFDTAAELLHPRHTALLVIDMQNETASLRGGYAQHGYDLSGIRNIIPTIQGLLGAARELQIPVVYTEFVHRDRRGVSQMDGPCVYLHRNEAWVSDVKEGTWEAQTLDELAPAPSDYVLQKSRASALYGTYLDNILRHHGIRTMVLTGCLTDGCVLRTAVHATECGYYTAVVRDGVGSLTAEKHALGLRFMEMKFPAFSSQEVSSTWKSALAAGAVHSA